MSAFLPIFLESPWKRVKRFPLDEGRLGCFILTREISELISLSTIVSAMNPIHVFTSVMRLCPPHRMPWRKSEDIHGKNLASLVS